MRWLLALLLSLRLAAAETYVVAAGVEKYDDERISALRFAVPDARAVAAAFRASGVGPRQVTVLCSDNREADRRPTRINLVTALERVKERARPGDKLVFFFAGHGLEENGEQFLLTVDTRRSLVRDTALPLRLVNEALRGIQATEVLFLIDACRNEPTAARADADARLTDGLARGLRPLLISQDGPKPRLVASLLSCQVGQRAWEDPEHQHGAFTVQLLRGLNGGAAGADHRVTLTDLASYVSREVTQWAERTNHHQTPVLLNPDGGEMVVLVAPSEPLVSVSLNNEPLATVVQRLGDDYGAQITLGKGVDPQARVTGRLEHQPLSAALKVLLAAYDLRIRRVGEVLVIESASTAVDPTSQGTVVAADGTGEYRSLAEAVKRAQPGATIVVKPGVYTESVVVDKDLTIVGDGPVAAVVIETVGRPGLRALAGSLALRGLTVRRLYSNEPPPAKTGTNAGAAELQATEVVAVDCVFEAVGNAHGHQAALQTGKVHGAPSSCAVRLRGCRLIGVPPEAAAYLEGGSVVTLDGSEVTADLVAWGGPHVEVRDCLVNGVLAGNQPGLPLTTVRLTNCRLSGRSIALSAMADAEVTATGCQIQHCDLAVRVWRGGRVVVRGCTIAFTSSKAFLADHGATLEQSGNTFDPGDTTVPAAPTFALPGYLSKWADQMPKTVQFRIREQDGMPQVLIPAGEFLMGAPNADAKRVYVSAFWLDLHEVTVAQYRQFCRVTGQTMPEGQATDNEPVADVDWAQATAYAKWVGGALPTDAQWEKAARGGVDGQTYPWGNDWDATKANLDSQHTVPVGTYRPNGYGLFDMAGNVWQWCLDFYDEGWSAHLPPRDPVNTAAGDSRVMRGGSFRAGAWCGRAASRQGYRASAHSVGLGFRVSQTP